MISSTPRRTVMKDTNPILFLAWSYSYWLRKIIRYW
jgi:hypothetical protein